MPTASRLSTPSGLVEQSQHGALAVCAGQRGDSHVHRAPTQAQADTAVLRQAFFRDVELGHDFQARNQRRVQGAVGLYHLAEHAVDAKAHAGVALVGLDVDVAGALAHGLRQQRVEHADDGRVVGRLQQVLDLGQLLQQAREIGLAFDFADDGRGRGPHAVRVGGLQAAFERVSLLPLQTTGSVAASDLADRAPARHALVIRGVAHVKPRFAAVDMKQHAVLARVGVGQGVGGAHRVGEEGGVAAAGGSTGALSTAWARLGVGCASCCKPRIHS
jgi:hypothetical protein